jgi:hypothetical protein
VTRVRNWANVVYDAEEALALRWRWPFLELADMISMWEALRVSQAFPKGEWPLEFSRLHQWRQESGIIRLRGRWGYQVGSGSACGGALIHEVSHLPGWRRQKPHNDTFLRTWLALWKQEARTVVFNAIVSQLRQGGVPVEEFV